MIKENKNLEFKMKLMFEPILSDVRKKGIKTLMRKRNVSYEQARKIQAEAIMRNYEV